MIDGLGYKIIHSSPFQPFFIVIKDKSLGTIRADIVHAFLTVSSISFLYIVAYLSSLPCFCLLSLRTESNDINK
jgi:hypothetical protein